MVRRATARAVAALGASAVAGWLLPAPAPGPATGPSPATASPVPVAKAAPRAGAGAYTYLVGGATVAYTPAPPGFDPSRATAAELARYNIPPPPAGGAGRAAWEADMAKLHFVAPPVSLRVVRTHASTSVTDYSDHWAGYVAYGGPFQRVTATWSQPSLKPSRCRAGALTLWAGMGGYGSTYLAQDGTSLGAPGLGRDQAFWEITPVGMVPVPLSASPGSPFTADVSYLGRGKFSFFMENDRTGAAWSQTESGAANADQSTVEVIAERPCLSGCSGAQAHYAHLGNFGTVKFSSSLVDGHSLGNFSNYSEAMYTLASPDGHELAFPSPLAPDRTSFTVTQSSCA